MTRSYEYADVIQRKIEGHLKSLGFNMKQPKIHISIDHNNYIRTVQTTLNVLYQAVDDIPVNYEGESNDCSTT